MTNSLTSEDRYFKDLTFSKKRYIHCGHISRKEKCPLIHNDRIYIDLRHTIFDKVIENYDDGSTDTVKRIDIYMCKNCYNCDLTMMLEHLSMNYQICWKDYIMSAIKYIDLRIYIKRQKNKIYGIHNVYRSYNRSMRRTDYDLTDNEIINGVITLFRKRDKEEIRQYLSSTLFDRYLTDFILTFL